jgi:3-hydroxybutyryl-CoA dehydrogenase
MKTIERVGVIGAGTMGNGIAQACATAGVDVVMVDVAQPALDRGVAAIGASLERLQKKDKITADARDAARARHGDDRLRDAFARPSRHRGGRPRTSS